MHFLVRFEPRPGCEEAFRHELIRLAPPTRAEPGCLRLQILESAGDPRTFAIHSEWTSEAAFEQHAALPHTARFLAAAAELLTHPVQGLRLREIAVPD
jgi:quinol monooxygenase YgiN